ncbi:MAG: hypothetical protein M0P70_15180 [Desulfobulbaceae bacterium]|nr:hypothetical protein [Desulfobulbaceae bacterium]
MKIWLPCNECVKKYGPADVRASYRTDVVEDRLIVFTCSEGHVNRYYVQGIKYQLLFEASFRALVEGFYLEAVLGFTASLERFYEFYCKFVCHKHGFDKDGFKETWKQVSNQSERQFGAFLFLYGIEEKRPFESKKYKMDKLTKFRNQVIHKGCLPLEEQVIEYGELVFNLIMPVSVELAVKDAEYFHTVTNGELFPDMEKYRERTDVRSTGIGSILGVTYDPVRGLEKSFREELKKARSNLLLVIQQNLIAEKLRIDRART